jgi:hypothetical protein
MEQRNHHKGVWIESGERPAASERSGRQFMKDHGNQLWRIFFIQSSRNERTVDGLGFFSIVSPLIRAWARTGQDAKEIARRHLGYFNANPCLASFVAGAVVNLEQRRERGDGVTPDEIDRVKAALSSALSARGNYFFETVLMPLGLTIASIFAMYDSYIGLVIFLALYNFYHFRSRIGGYRTGAERGEGAAEAFVTRLFREERFFGNCAACASGVFTALLFVRARAAGNASFLAWGAVAIAGAVLLRKRLSFVRSVAVLFATTALYLVAKSYVFAVLR